MNGPSVDDERAWNELRKEIFPRWSDHAVLTSAEIGTPARVPSSFDPYAQCRDYDALSAAVETARTRLARLLNCAPARLFFTDNTTSALHSYLRARTPHKGQEILTTSHEYGSMTGLLRRELGPFGIRTRKVRAGERLLRELERAIRPETAFVMTSHITHAGCEMLPVEGIAALAKERGVPYVLDAAQSVGHIPVDIAKLKPDALFGCAHKWLHCDTALGFLYLAQGEPPAVLLSSPWSAPAGARMGITPELKLDYDGPGNAQTIAYFGDILKRYEAIGWDAMHARMAYLGDAARERLAENPFVTLVEHARPSPAMIPFHVGLDPEQGGKRQALAAFGVHVTHKEGHEILRAAPCAFNTLDDIARLDGAAYLIGRGVYSHENPDDVLRERRARHPSHPA